LNESLLTDDFEMACALIENHPRPSNKCKSRVAASKQAMPLDAFLQHTDFDICRSATSSLLIKT